MRIVTELMDRVFSDSTPQEFKDLVMNGIEKAFSEGSCELVGEGYNLSFAEAEGNVAIEDKLHGNEITIAKPSGDEVKLEASATQPNVVVPKVEGVTKPVEAPGSTQPDVKDDIEPAIVDKDKAGKDKHFTDDSEEVVLTFSESEIENVAFAATETHELYERLQGTQDLNLAMQLYSDSQDLAAYATLAKSFGYDTSDLIENCAIYSEYADEVLTKGFSDMDVNEYFSELSEDEINEYFSGLDEVQSQVLYSALIDQENNYTFSDVEDAINEVYSEIELSQSVQEAFSEFDEDDLNEYFSQFTDNEIDSINRVLDENPNASFSDVNEALNELYTPMDQIFSDCTEEELKEFADQVGEDEAMIAFSMALDENYTYSDFLDAIEELHTFSEDDAATLVENTQELEKAAKAVTESPDDCELAKKVKVLADKTAEDAESAREAGYEELANEVQQKCQSFSEAAAEALDNAGVDPKSIDAEKVLEEVKEAKATAEHADDKAGAAVQKAAEAKGDAEGAKAAAEVATKAAEATPVPDKVEPAAAPAEGTKEDEPAKEGEPAKEEQKAHSKYSHVFGTETRAFSKGMPTKQSNSVSEQKLFSETTGAPTKSKYSTLKSAIN